MTGTIAAAFGWIFFLEGFLRILLGQLGTDAPSWRFVLYPITLLLLMLVRPQGLLGTVEWGFFKAEGLGATIKAAVGIKPKKAGE
jgi:branched-chain amino acid transport system permease protein